jgi:hypothetical protein
MTLFLDHYDNFMDRHYIPDDQFSVIVRCGPLLSLCVLIVNK